MTDKTKNINTTALAYIGDAVYEIYIRKHCIEGGQHNVDVLHKKAVKFVRADGQALAVKTMRHSLDSFILKRIRTDWKK